MDDLPFYREDEDQAEPGPSLASTVLVVDDEAVVLDVFTRLLARETDLTVKVAVDAENALDLLRGQRVDLLVTDKNLPGMGGVELIVEARKIRPTLEAIMITGYASAESVLNALAAGASDYLVKPFDDLRVVRAKVRAALGRRTARIQSRGTSREMARRAAQILATGKEADAPTWARLQDALSEYERATEEGGHGSVAVIGNEGIVDHLNSLGLRARRATEESMLLRVADVVVIETGHGDWRPLAERLQALPPDLLLLASPETDISDLLEAIGMRIDLIGFGGKTSPRQLPDRIKAILLRRAVERAQDQLGAALTDFQESLAEQ